MYFDRKDSFMSGVIFGIIFASLIWAFCLLFTSEDKLDSYTVAPYGSYEEDREIPAAPDKSEFKWEV